MKSTSRKIPRRLVVEMGLFPPSLISLWAGSAVSAAGTQKRNSVRALAARWEFFFFFFPTACSHPPFSPHELTCWKKHMLLFSLPDSLCCLNGILLTGSSCLERGEGLRKEKMETLINSNYLTVERNSEMASYIICLSWVNLMCVYDTVTQLWAHLNTSPLWLVQPQCCRTLRRRAQLMPLCTMIVQKGREAWSNTPRGRRNYKPASCIGQWKTAETSLMHIYGLSENFLLGSLRMSSPLVALPLRSGWSENLPFSRRAFIVLFGCFPQRSELFQMSSVCVCVCIIYLSIAKSVLSYILLSLPVCLLYPLSTHGRI